MVSQPALGEQSVCRVDLAVVMQKSRAKIGGRARCVDRPVDSLKNILHNPVQARNIPLGNQTGYDSSIPPKGIEKGGDGVKDSVLAVKDRGRHHALKSMPFDALDLAGALLPTGQSEQALPFAEATKAFANKIGGKPRLNGAVGGPAKIEGKEVDKVGAKE